MCVACSRVRVGVVCVCMHVSVCVCVWLLFSACHLFDSGHALFQGLLLPGCILCAVLLSLCHGERVCLVGTLIGLLASSSRCSRGCSSLRSRLVVRLVLLSCVVRAWRIGPTVRSHQRLLEQLPTLVLQAPVARMNEERYLYMKDLVRCCVMLDDCLLYISFLSPGAPVSHGRAIGALVPFGGGASLLRGFQDCSS